MTDSRTASRSAASSSVSAPERNRLTVRVYGSDAGLEWSQENPNRLRLVDPNGDRVRDHWDRNAHALLVGVILHVLYAEADKTLTF